MLNTRIPQIDFSLIPSRYEGSWVVVRVGDAQRVLGFGDTAEQAVSSSGVSSDDLTAVLTQVPDSIPVAYLGLLGSE